MTNKSKNTIDIKNALSLDLDRLKHLDLGIIPARTYYSRLFVGWFCLLIIVLGIESTACFLAMNTHAWEYAPHTQTNEFREIIEDAQGNIKDVFRAETLRLKLLQPLTRSHPLHLESRYLSDEEEQKIEQTIRAEQSKREAQRLERKKTRTAELEQQRQNQHERQVAGMISGVLLSSILISIFGLGRIKNYIIFNYQISPQLHTGNYLIQKVHGAILGFIFIFGLLCVLFFPLLEQSDVFFSSMASLIGAVVAISLITNLEASRIGVSVLFLAISKFFNPNKQGISHD
jgi:hypothetical protein